MDKFKAPQARPLNTLSSGAPPLLKTPDKEATRSPAPYTFHQPSEAPREAVVPKSMQLPTPSAPTASSPGSTAQAKRAAESANAPPPSWPAQPTSPPRIVEKVEKKLETPSSSSSSLTPQTTIATPAPVAPKQVQPESTADILAKAFLEEAKALEQGSDDLLESSNFDQLNSLASDLGTQVEADSKYDSPYFEAKPKGSLGFGNLLSSGTAAQNAEGSQEHSNLADLMIPTGEHQALFAPDRRGEDESISPFDEVQPETQSELQAHVPLDNSDNFSANLAAASAESVRVDEKPAPAFSSLFSTEIVTSGQDYSFTGAPDTGASAEAPSNFLDEIKTLDDDAQTFTPPPAYEIDEPSQSSGLLSQSDAISKLLEAVNKEQQANVSTDIDSSFSDPAFTASSFSEADDMRTADTMFGSGGSNKGSAEELSAADAVFGAVPDLVAPVPEGMLEAIADSNSASSVSSASSATSSSSSTSSSGFPEQPVLGKDSLPMAFADAANFEQESLESIKQGIRKAKAEEKARKKAEEQAKMLAAAEPTIAEPTIAESVTPVEEVVAGSAAPTDPVAAQAPAESVETPKPSEQQSPKSTAKLSLTEMIELANSAKLEQVNEGKPTTSTEQPSAAKSSLSSLLSGALDDEPALEPHKEAEDDEDEDEDEGDSLGGAISDALDKLLASGQEEQSQSFAVDNSDTQIKRDTSVADSSFASSSFANSTFPPPLPEPAESIKPPAARAEAFASTSNQVEEEQPLTQTQANKVDALSRLLEVASKAPHKSPDDKRSPSDSASKIAAEINKPPGKVSRQVETISAADYGQPNQGAAMSSPFGGSSPFSSPFNSPSASQTRQAGQDPSVSSGSGSGMSNPYDGVSGMPQATVSNDAVSARIAALNRKLEEQSRPPSASAVNMEAMAQIQQQAEAQAQSQSQSSVGTGTGTGSSPSVNSLSQLPPQVDDSPSTRAELVNRILGSAKISQHGTKMPELPTRTVSEAISPEQTAAIRGGKNSQAPARTRARVARMPGFDIRPIMAIVVLLVVIGGGAFYAYQSGIIKLNLPDVKGGGDAKATIDQMIKSGDLDRAREILEAKVNTGKITASEGEKLHSVYYQMANKIDNEDPAEAVKLLEKIPSRSKKFKDAQKLLRKLKRKVKKN
ncbi:MAG: hypothetical protein WCT03_05185 [Candidatus Obscuribacterales bacterium]